MSLVSTNEWNDAARRDALTRDSLQLVAEGVIDFAEFKIASIVIVRGDEIECVAVAGSEGAARRLLGRRTQTSVLMDMLPRAEDWGVLRFVPHAQMPDAAIEISYRDPDPPPSTLQRAGAGADPRPPWHPDDALFAPLYGPDDQLLGILSVDQPLSGWRPGVEQRTILERYAVHALRAIQTTLEREELAERIAVTGAARRIVRAASSDLSLDSVLAQARAALLEGFHADGLWWRLFPVTGEDGIRSDDEPDGDGLGVEMPWMDQRVLVVAAAMAHHAWDVQQVVTASAEAPLPLADSFPADTVAVAEAFLSHDGIGSVLIIPLGAGKTCLGLAVLHRRNGADWSTVETEEALDVGHDLGRAVLNARLYERELDLVHRLQALDTYKSQLISTISHELRTPLTSIIGNLELMMDLVAEDERDPTLALAAAATGRGARRLVSLVEDLLLLSRVDDPDAASSRHPVDLRDVVADVVALHATAAQEQGVAIVIDSPGSPVVVLGDVVQLDRLLVNLLSNAVKYSRTGGTVCVSVELDGQDAVLTCADQGLGISPTDQQHIFGEFFRSGDPSVRAVSGTGLGLAISRRVVDGHGGRIELSSRLGVGSSFRVVLPAAPAGSGQ